MRKQTVRRGPVDTSPRMKTVRFAKVVEDCGKPENYLILTDPERDRTLQNATRTERVMTLFQSAVGQRADYGKIGLDPGPSRQFLIFPESLRKFAGAKVVGVKYDLIETKELRNSERAPKPKPPVKKMPRKPVKTAEKEGRVDPAKVVKFPEPTDPEEEEEDWKPEVRRAMKLLEDAKYVAAFNILKRLME